MVRFTLRQCSYFRAVAAHGGIAQAARALNISQPSVAQALDKLEEITGLVLFERYHARGLTLTSQGREFLRHATWLEQQAEQVEQEASALAAGAAGEIRLGVFWSLAAFYAARLIHEFSDVAPAIRIRQREMSLARLADALREGSIDVAITYDRGGDHDGLTFVELAALRPMAVVAAGHPFAGRESVDLQELANEPYVMFDAPGSRSYFEHFLAEHGINPRIAYVSTSLEGVRSAVAAGFGFTVLTLRPPSQATYDGGSVKVLQIQNAVQPLHIVLASLEGARQTPALQRFADHAIAYFGISKASASENAQEDSFRNP